MNVLVTPSRTDSKTVKIPVDVVIQPKSAELPHLPVLIEAKSAGDFTNVNKRRKEEATKVNQLRATFTGNVVFALFLCGYFDAAYLGYEAAEGIDWVWEHRIGDLDQLGI
jgi:type II restriction enzyme